MDYSFIVLLVSIFAARFIQINAFKTLADEDKGKVMSKNIMQLSQVSLVFTIVLVLVFYFLISKPGANYLTLTIVFFILLLAQRIIVYIITRKRMIENDVPSTYINKYFLSWLVTTAGVVGFIFLAMQPFFNGTIKR